MTGITWTVNYTLFQQSEQKRRETWQFKRFSLLPSCVVSCVVSYVTSYVTSYPDVSSHNFSIVRDGLSFFFIRNSFEVFSLQILDSCWEMQVNQISCVSFHSFDSSYTISMLFMMFVRDKKLTLLWLQFLKWHFLLFNIFNSVLSWKTKHAFVTCDSLCEETRVKHS